MRRRSKHSAQVVRRGFIEQLETRCLLAGVDPSSQHPFSSLEPLMADGRLAPYYPEVGVIAATTDLVNFPGFCTGTLIDRQHVLTAAHCVDNGDGTKLPANYFITSQNADARINGTPYKIIDVVVADGYRQERYPNGKFKSIRNDLAILRLETLVRDAVPVPIFRQPPVEGDVLAILGFGRVGTRNGPSTQNGTTRYFGLIEIDDVTQRTFSHRFDQKGESNTGPGDSGGPSLISLDGKTVQIAGVHSYGDVNFTSVGAESHDERVDVHAAWIDRVLARDYAAGPTVVIDRNNNITEAGSVDHHLRLTYTDVNGVTQSNVNQPHISLSGPNNYFSNTPEIGLVIRSSDGTRLTVDYRFRGPGGTWTASENGTYTVSLLNNGIKDGLGNSVGARQIATFSVSLPNDGSSPTAVLEARNVTAGGSPFYNFSVRYADNFGIDASTLGNDDLEVIRTDGAIRLSARIVTSPSVRDAKSIGATYQITPPGGKWDSADNGTYRVVLRSGTVRDVNRISVPGAELGTFQVNIASGAPLSPYAVLNAPDITTTSGNRKQTFTITYHDDAAINIASVLDNRNEIIVEPSFGATADIARLVSVSPNANGSPIVATYEYDSFKTWTAVDDGVFFTVSLMSGSAGGFVGNVTDTSGNAVPGGILGVYRIANRSGSQDRIAPQAQLQASNVRYATDQPQSLIVAFSDNDAIAVTTLTDDSVFVLGPENQIYPLTVGGVNYASDEPIVAAKYFIAPPGGTWDEEDDGLYRVVVRDGAVSDRQGNTVPGGDATAALGTELGSFSVNIVRDNDTNPTTAMLTANNLFASGQTYYEFTVTYSDPNGINVSTLGDDDLFVSSGDGKYEQFAQLVGLDASGDGTPRTATYRITPPGTAWVPADNGQYDIYVAGLDTFTVASTTGNAVSAGLLGSFQIGVELGELALSKNQVAENQAGAVIGQVSVTGIVGPFTYSISDPRFEIVAEQLKLKANQSLDFEGGNEIQLTITAVSSNSQTTKGDFKIVVADENEPPTNIVLSAAKLLENEVGVVSVGTLSVIDPDHEQSYSYTVDDLRFAIVGNELQLRDGFINFEEEPEIRLSITATDRSAAELHVSKTITIQILDANDPPILVLSPSPRVPEEQIHVLTLAATDEDRPQQQLEYWITDGPDAEMFTIVEGNQLAFLQLPDFETPLDSNRDNTYEITVTVTDGRGMQASAALKILVQDIDEFLDSDFDGRADSEEAGAPNGGDGNRDSIPDATQSKVSSLLIPDTENYVTLEASGDLDLVNVTGSALAAGAISTEVDPIAGQVQFDISGLSSDGATTITIYSNVSVQTNAYYKFGPTVDNPTPHFYRFLYDGRVGAEIFADRIVVHLRDGERGDDDLAHNGVISSHDIPAVNLSSIPYRNPNIVWDVNDDGSVAPIDALMIINELHRSNQRDLVVPLPVPITKYRFLDPTGDNKLSPFDALLVINELNRRKSSGEGEGSEIKLLWEGPAVDPSFGNVTHTAAQIEPLWEDDSDFFSSEVPTLRNKLSSREIRSTANRRTGGSGDRDCEEFSRQYSAIVDDVFSQFSEDFADLTRLDAFAGWDE